MPNAQCPMPNAQCPMPNAQCPIPKISLMIHMQIVSKMLYYSTSEYK
ncbi:hypothetical protein H6G41_25205 [Tolypothrix sp. FACHB-123]|nr:hypothetical protein [Tolypothrix sp. FACHB-123]MBD2357870.1 hypothetical protein [Tolypothrix sp. FACHB-123]